jgi:hypothetical protein
MPYAASAPVVGVVAASGKRVGRRFDMGDITLSVVNGRRKPSKYFGGLGKGTGDRERMISEWAGSVGPAIGASAASAASAAPATPVALSAPSSAPCPHGGGGKVVMSEGVNGTPGGPKGVNIAMGLTNGSTAKVTKVSPELTDSLKRALERLADDGEERDLDAWVVWYEALLAPEAPKQP